MLANGQVFPALNVAAVASGIIRLPDALSRGFGVVVVYRGDWCPFCNEQLASLQGASAQLAELGVKIVAFSVDDEATTAALAKKLGLTFTLGHSADPKAVAALTGAFVGDHAGHAILQPTAFLLSPDGKIMMESFASGPIGRFTGSDLARVVGHIKSMMAKA